MKKILKFLSLSIGTAINIPGLAAAHPIEENSFTAKITHYLTNLDHITTTAATVTIIMTGTIMAIANHRRKKTKE